MLNLAFLVNQAGDLAAHNIDPQIHGVCWAMSYDWIKRALCGLPHLQATYTGQNMSRFISQQRAYAQSANPQNFVNSVYQNDNLVVNSTRGSNQFNFVSIYHMTDFIEDGIDDCAMPSVGYLQLIGPGGSHGTAFSLGVANGGGSFFDPLRGQYTQGGGMRGNPLGRDIYDFLCGPPALYNIIAWRAHVFTGLPRDSAWLTANNP